MVEAWIKSLPPGVTPEDFIGRHCMMTDYLQRMVAAYKKKKGR